MFSQVFRIILSTGGVYEVTFCLTALSHVLSEIGVVGCVVEGCGEGKVGLVGCGERGCGEGGGKW